jgi:flagellar basal-body rod modification protein FlgD
MDGIGTDYDLYANLGLVKQLQVDENNSLKIDDFMHLMVTELTHQDPFKPMDNTEMATQISQFATVSGIDQLNSSFSTLADSMLSDRALQAANLVGHDVLVTSQFAPLTTGGNVEGMIDLPRSASNLTLRVSNAATGTLVRELSLGSHDAGQVAFNWDGYDDAGDYMLPGLYQVSALATVDDVEMAPQVLVSAQVDSVSIGASGQALGLNLNGLGTVSINDVTEIR